MGKLYHWLLLWEKLCETVNDAKLGVRTQLRIRVSRRHSQDNNGAIEEKNKISIPILLASKKVTSYAMHVDVSLMLSAYYT